MNISEIAKTKMSNKENDFSDSSFTLMNTYKQKSKKKKTFSFNDVVLDEIDLTNEQYIKTSNRNKTSRTNTSDQDNLSDSSLILINPYKQRSKIKKNTNYNEILDTIDLTNESKTELKDFKLKTKHFSNIKKGLLSDGNDKAKTLIKTCSNECVKSTTNLLSDFNYNSKNQNDKLHFANKSLTKLECDNLKLDNLENESSSFQNNYTTPKKNHIQSNDILESTKLLDRIYGNEWRHIDGVIRSSQKKKPHRPIENSNLYDENILNKDNNENSSSFLTNTSHHIKKPKNIQDEVNDTSIILENISLSENKDNQLDSSIVLDHQLNYNISLHNTNECNNVKKKPSKKNGKIDKNIKSDHQLNHQSKTPTKPNLPAKLSFLSSLSSFTGSMICNPEAEKYKSKFKKNKDDLVSVLFKLFNEEVFENKLPADMNFKWNARLRTTAGACFNRRAVKINANLDCERVSRIELSSKIIDTSERLRDTLVHELCHAACWILNGVAEGHGPLWKNWANKAMDKFPELPIIKRCHSYQVQTKFTYKCKQCGYSFGRHSKSLKLEKKRCGYCYGEFELILNKINNNLVASNNLPVVYTDPVKELYNLNNVQQKPIPPKKPSKFALFVKENYHIIKRESPLLKHGEIMKLLGEKYATTKILTSDEIFDKLLDNNPQSLT